MWNECELTVKNDSEEFGLVDNRDDVLLIADIFEHFRWTKYASHRLDCLHFITLPSLAWAMALKHTDAKLDLIADPQAYLMIENNMRGGIATIFKRYACANNHLLEDFDLVDRFSQLV